VTDWTPTTTNNTTFRDDAGPQNDADGCGRRGGRFKTTWHLTVQYNETPVRNDVTVLNNRVSARPIG